MYFFRTILALLILTLNTFAQNEGAKWFTGGGAGIDFMTTPPSTFAVNTLTVQQHGAASISDAAGNLLFYSDGVTVWNRNHLVMANGTGIIGNHVAIQAALILKQPGNNSLFYLFSNLSQGPSIGGNYLHYSIVDMSLAAGNGSVVTKNVPPYFN